MAGKYYKTNRDSDSDDEAYTRETCGNCGNVLDDCFCVDGNFCYGCDSPAGECECRYGS